MSSLLPGQSDFKRLPKAMPAFLTLAMARWRWAGAGGRGCPGPWCVDQAGDRRPCPGQVQSESPAEVVVTLGTNSTTVPTDQIASIRYDGQSASFSSPRAARSTGQLARRPILKKAAAESAGRPFVRQMALFREAQGLRELCCRAEPAKDPREAPSSSRAIRAAATSSRHARYLARLQLNTGDFAGAEATIASSPGCLRRPTGPRVRTRVLARQGPARRGLSGPTG